MCVRGAAGQQRAGKGPAAGERDRVLHPVFWPPSRTSIESVEAHEAFFGATLPCSRGAHRGWRLEPLGTGFAGEKHVKGKGKGRGVGVRGRWKVEGGR